MYLILSELEKLQQIKPQQLLWVLG